MLKINKPLLFIFASIILGISLLLPINLTLAATTAATPATATPADKHCADGSIATAVRNSNMFPFIPPAINSSDDTGCSPAFWTVQIIGALIYKAIRLINWAALAISGLAIVYSGFMYILGFANEANVKKAKSIIIATFVGLIIVTSAKWIVYGTILIFNGSKSVPSSTNILIPN